MPCPSCRQDTPPGAQFCPECGAGLGAACPRCGTANHPSHKFCVKCGHHLVGTAGAHTRPYTPKHLAERILASPSAMEGEQKQVTVLFCDVVESSVLAQRLGPEGMHQVMDRAFRLMADAVHRYDGTVNQFLGDGLMALFGAPVSLEDHAVRGVQAALAIIETIGGYSRELATERGVELRLRLGLNTGLVVVGRIGDDLRMDYTAIGDTTNLAARLVRHAAPGTILISPTTQRLVEGYFSTERMDPIEVKGRREAVGVWTVRGRGRGRTRFDVVVERGLTPLVARRGELELLHECLASSRAGHGQVFGIVGEPGAGKSRLLHEFRRTLDGERVTWLEARCVGWGQATPYLPILELLRRNFQIEEDDHPFQIGEKLRQGMLSLDPELTGIIPFLRELFGLAAEDETLRFLDPQLRRRKTFEAIRALTLTGSRRRPLALVVEDLQWIDQTSEDFLAYLVESLAGMPILLVTTHRVGYAVRWADWPHYTQVALDVLTEEETTLMAQHLLGTDQLPPELPAFVYEKAEGNPLFIEEITRSLLEHGALGKRNGAITWFSENGVAFPATMKDIIGARIDRLDDPAKRTVQTASVIGRAFGVRLLTRVVDTGMELQGVLHTLKHQALIHERCFFPEVEYVFKHAVIQDVVYQSLRARRRAELHGVIGHAIEELYADRLEEQAPILAHHFSRSPENKKAIQYALLAGDRAARLYANAEAATYYDEALNTARKLGPTPEGQRLEIDAAIKRAAVSLTRQDVERDRENLEQACARAAALGDEPRMAQVLYWLGRIHYVRYDPRAAIDCATRSLAIADRLEDAALAAPPVNLMGRLYWQESAFARSGEMLVRSAELMRKLGNKSEEATSLGFAGWVLALMGEFDRALALLDEGLRIAREIRNPFAEAAICHYRASAQLLRGDLAPAFIDYEEGQQAAERAGDLARLVFLKSWEGYARCAADEPRRGKELLDEAETLAGRIGTKFGLAWLRTFQGACHAALGEPARAMGYCDEAIALGKEGGDKWIEAVAHRIMAEVVRRLDWPALDRAEQATRRSIELARTIDARPELARSLVTRARVLADGGDVEGARRQLSEALDLFAAMGMSRDLQRTRTVLEAA